MSSIAFDILNGLLSRVERARVSGDTRDVTIPMTLASARAYVAALTAADREEVHAFLARAERAGAVYCHWDIAAGSRRQLSRVTVADRDALAQFVGRTPFWTWLERAEEALADTTVDEVAAFLTAWRAGKVLRSLGPEHFMLVSDAARLVSYLRLRPLDDRPIRAVSTALFGDSKRVFALAAALDVLLGTSEGRARPADEVFAELGLVRAPMPVLIAGPITIATPSSAVAVPEPYVGLAPSSIIGIAHGADRVRYVLTVENLEPFHELARGKAGSLGDCLVVYTAGMTSPAWRRAYLALIDALHVAVPLYHWGDVDLGGLRIAERIGRDLQQRGRALRPHLMDPAQLRDIAQATRSLAPGDVREMLTLADKLGWTDVRRGIEETRTAIEQEALEPCLPGETAMSCV